MASIEEQIRSAASRNAALLEVLNKTDHAPPALIQQNKYVDELMGEIAASDKEIRHLEHVRDTSLKGRKYHDSVMRRLAYRAAGQKEKFAAKASTEEKEYYEALRVEHRAKEQREAQAQLLDSAMQIKHLLEPIAAEHDQAQTSLDTLYNSIFSGATPAFATEDTAELAVTTAQQSYRDAEALVRREEQVHDLLAKALALKPWSLKYLKEAKEEAEEQQSATFPGHGYSYWEKQEILHLAEGYTNGMNKHVDRACVLAPTYVKPLPRFKIAVDAEMEYLGVMEENLKSYNSAVEVLGENVKMNDEKLREVKEERDKARGRLEESRKVLQKVREGIFEEIIGKKAKV